MTDDTFIEAIANEPANQLLRLVFADHLEETGRWQAAQRVREWSLARPETYSGDVRARWWRGQPLPPLHAELGKGNSTLWMALNGFIDSNAFFKEYETEADGMRMFMNALLEDDDENLQVPAGDNRRAARGDAARS